VPGAANSDWIDVSVAVTGGMLHWPTDPAVKITLARSIDAGDDANVSHLDLGAHTGTHMDAPIHFVPGGDGIDAMPPEATVGPARVIAIEDPEAARPEELRRHEPRAGERLLLRSRNSDRDWVHQPFDPDFVHISPEGAELLAESGVRTVGVDYLSVGGYRGGGAETHRALLEAGVWIIEGLDLSSVEPGDYELVCLPVKIAGSDGAPARALVRPAERG
jgi:arylformamidase